MAFIDSYALTVDEVLCAEVVSKSRRTNFAGTDAVRPTGIRHPKRSNLPQGETVETIALQPAVDYAGCVGEIAVARLMNLAWTGCGKTSGNTRDVGNYIEVRSVRNIKLGLLVRPKDPEAPFVLVFVRGNTGKILGWAWKSEVVAKGRMLDGDTERPCWILKDTLRRAEGLTVVAHEAQGHQSS
jgi:hypothetical protein|tara:strand:- start:2884 stop:3435 length:552 start_codon:yes stop_codon:yes gene_type:complete